ncbi:MAG: folate-dependent phosphoribosylglycinamide formyltransferase PurN, partial [Planctomycetota bacterium]
KKLNLDVIIVNGTRIISSKVLESMPALFINIHTGVTLQYGGVHGAYWH